MENSLYQKKGRSVRARAGFFPNFGSHRDSTAERARIKKLPK
jgi:hypothetical protein